MSLELSPKNPMEEPKDDKISDNNKKEDQKTAEQKKKEDEKQKRKEEIESKLYIDIAKHLNKQEEINFQWCVSDTGRIIENSSTSINVGKSVVEAYEKAEEDLLKNNSNIFKRLILISFNKKQ